MVLLIAHRFRFDEQSETVMLVAILFCTTRMLVLFGFADVQGIIFDLDGTLVSSALDFASIKAEIGCEKESDILTFIEKIECENQQARAKQIVLEHELDDAHSSTWLPGAERFVYQAKTYGLPLAIVTRNCRQAAQIKIINNNIPIDLFFTREDAPAKPDPTALIMIAQKWQIETTKIAYIGDYIYDIEAAHNSKMQAWLYCDKHESYRQNLSFILPNNTKKS